MNESIIKDWNNTVAPGDEIFILGDVSFAGPKDSVGILRRLNGKKFLIAGNHDKKNLKEEDFRKQFVWVKDYADISVDGNKVCLFHYPIAEFDGMHRGSVHFHGHLHGNTSGLEEYRVKDVGMDTNMCQVYNLPYLVKETLKGKIKSHH